MITKDNGGACEPGKVKPLILFEDVDITFLEDRGFIAAVQHIAETAKGPLILTTNSKGAFFFSCCLNSNYYINFFLKLT